MAKNKANSPYIKNEHRLADVIAAIQTLGTYRYYKMDFGGWADRICGDEKRAEHWAVVFREHPEFFRLDASRQKASLVIRRQHSKQFNVDTHALLSKDEFNALTNDEKKKISRSPLSAEEISTLINTAVLLHARAIEHERNMRWWLPLLVAVFSAVLAFLGAVVGGFLKLQP